ncbi:hypothetical protein F4801DRAFT_156001 [Xylaria longipes]|nr:hypothetical protein F4801DRAFT_156001 [Xylaria longipes]
MVSWRPNLPSQPLLGLQFQGRWLWYFWSAILRSAAVGRHVSINQPALESCEKKQHAPTMQDRTFGFVPHMTKEM